MTSKHTGMPLYGSEVGPMSIPVAAAGESLPTTVTVPIPAPTSVPEPDPIDTLPYVPDAEEEEEGEVTSALDAELVASMGEETDTSRHPGRTPSAEQHH